MKINTIGITLILIAFLGVWLSASPQLQVKNKQNINLKAYTQQIDIMKLRIQKLEDELIQMKKVIRINGNNVEIVSPARLKLNALNLILNAQQNMKLESTANMTIKSLIINQSSSAMTIKSSDLMSLSSNAMALKAGLIRLN